MAFPSSVRGGWEEETLHSLTGCAGEPERVQLQHGGHEEDHVHDQLLMLGEP